MWLQQGGKKMVTHRKRIKRLEISKISTKPLPMGLGTSLRAVRDSADRRDRALPGRGRGRSPLRKAAVPVPSEGARRRLHFRAGAEAPAGASGPGLPRGVPAAAATRGRPGLEAPAGPHGKGRERRRRLKTKRMPQIPPRPAGLRHPPPSARSSPTSAYLGSRSGQASLPPSPGLGSRSPRGAPGLGRRVRALTMRGGPRYRAVLDVSGSGAGAGGPARPGRAAPPCPPPALGRRAGSCRHFGGVGGRPALEGKLSERAQGGAGPRSMLRMRCGSFRGWFHSGFVLQSLLDNLFFGPSPGPGLPLPRGFGVGQAVPVPAL